MTCRARHIVHTSLAHAATSYYYAMEAGTD